VNESKFYKCEFGGLRLWVSRWVTKKSRTIVKYPPAAGDDTPVEDRGEDLVEARASLLFDFMRGDALSPLDRLNQFKALLNGERRVLTHPIEGSFQALVEGFEYTLDDSSSISAECTFIAAQPIPDALPPGSTSIPASGAGGVDAAAADYKAELADFGLDDDGLADAATTAADGWASRVDVSTRDVVAESGQLSSQISDKANTLTNDMEAWQMFKSTLLLGLSLRSAAQNALNGDAAGFIVRLATDTSLRSLLASEFGADQVEFRLAQALDLNDLATPGLIPSGSEVRLPSPDAKARNG
jgi:hypothetical protein